MMLYRMPTAYAVRTLAEEGIIEASGTTREDRRL